MITPTMRAAAERAIGERHPYLIRFGPTVAKLAVAVIVLGGLVWGVASLAGSVGAPGRPDVSMPSVPLPGVPWAAVIVAALVVLVVAVAVWWRRSGYSVMRVGWRFYLV